MRHLLEALEARGVRGEDLLDGLAVSRDDLADAEAAVSLDDQITAVRRGLAQVPDAMALGIDVGLRVNLTHLGLLGFAAMASGSIRELMTVTLRYFGLTNLVIRVTLEEGPTTARIGFSAGHLPADVAPYFTARDLCGIAMVTPTFLGSTLEAHREGVRLTLTPDDAPFRDLVDTLPIGGARYDGTERVVEFPATVLDEPLPQADPHTLALCLTQCEQMLQRREARVGLAAAVRSLLLASTTAPPSADQVAAALLLHPRTLRRRLADEGTSYRALLEEVRRALAVEMITQVGLTVDEASRRLGYAETAAFTHAFTRWFGVPPSRYRSG